MPANPASPAPTSTHRLVATLPRFDSVVAAAREVRRQIGGRLAFLEASAPRLGVVATTREVSRPSGRGIVVAALIRDGKREFSVFHHDLHGLVLAVRVVMTAQPGVPR